MGAVRLSAIAIFVLLVGGVARAVNTPANVMVEISFEATGQQIDVAFTQPGGNELRVPAFWAGGKRWKVRYASPVVGTHKYKAEGLEGVVEVEPYKGDNPLYLHGSLRVDGTKRYLEHADGTPFLWIGDTWWMGLSKRLSWPTLCASGPASLSGTWRRSRRRTPPAR